MEFGSPIYDANGRTLFACGGERAWRTHDCGDYQVSMQWFGDGRSVEPCMVIWSTKRVDSGSYTICLSSIGRYADPSGKPTEEGLELLALNLPFLGREINARELNRLMDIVLRYTPELIKMPPAPRAIRQDFAGKPMFDVQLREGALDGEIVHEGQA